MQGYEKQSVRETVKGVDSLRYNLVSLVHSITGVLVAIEW